MTELLITDKKSKSLSAMVLDFALAAVTFLLASVVGVTLLFGVCKVDGSSMYPTLVDKSFIFCKSVETPQRGDIVVISMTNKRLVKRVVAVPGDKIVFVCSNDQTDMVGGRKKVKLYLRSEDEERFYKVDEDFIADGFMTDRGFNGQTLYRSDSFVESLSEEEIVAKGQNFIIGLNEGEYYVLGDNRDHSSDSRYYGKINVDKIDGKLEYTIDDGPFFYLLDVLYFVAPNANR